MLETSYVFRDLIPSFDNGNPKPSPALARRSLRKDVRRPRAAGREPFVTWSRNSVIEGGFPHSEIFGSKLVRSSPKLIAAYHVLHSLSAPRHPPNALKTLDRSHHQYPSTRRERTLFSLVSQSSHPFHSRETHITERPAFFTSRDRTGQRKQKLESFGSADECLAKRSSPRFAS